MEENTPTQDDANNVQEQPAAPEVKEKEHIIFNDDAFIHLEETRKWTLFLSILGFIGIGLSFIILFFSRLIFSSLALSNAAVASFGIPEILLMGLIMTLYFVPIYYLYQFSYNSSRALKERSSAYLAKAMKYLKYHYRFMGILVIVMLSIYVLVFIIAIAFGAFGAFMSQGRF